MTEIVFGNYNLKRRIEKLILWFLPTFVLSATFQFFYQKFMKHTVEQAIVEGAKIGNSISSAMLASYGIGFLDNIVVAIWLYFQSRDLKYNKLLWPILGLFNISVALIAFMGVTLFHTYQENSFNNKINRTD